MAGLFIAGQLFRQAALSAGYKQVSVVDKEEIFSIRRPDEFRKLNA
jgi:hypothetical protein